VMPCSVVKVWWHFTGSYCLHCLPWWCRKPDHMNCHHTTKYHITYRWKPVWKYWGMTLVSGHSCYQ
jgi:hypothetical protein